MKVLKRNQKHRLVDDIGRIFPELQSEIKKLKRPPSGPYTPGELYPWLFSTTLTVMKIVLYIGRRLLQELIESRVEGIDRPGDFSAGNARVCPCPKCSSLVWHYNGSEKRQKTFVSIFGEQILWRYQAECSRCGSTFFPLDCILGISSSVKILPLLQQLVVFLGTHLPFREAAEVLKIALCIEMSPETIRKAVLAVGKAVVRRQNQADWEPEINKFADAMKKAEGPCTLEGALDGAMVPLNKKPKAEPESHKEARSVSLRLKDATGSLLGKLIISRLTELPSFLVSVSSLLDECRETVGIKKVLLTGDGARWIWQFAKNNEISRTVLDWYHIHSYFVSLSYSCQHGKSRARRDRLKRIEEALWNGKVDVALEEIKGFRCRSGEESKAKRDLHRYVKNNRAHIINYNWNWHRKKLVGSGAIEGGQQKSIHDRLRCAGMRWSEPGADYMMAARCSELNDTANYDVRNANLAS